MAVPGERKLAGCDGGGAVGDGGAVREAGRPGQSRGRDAGLAASPEVQGSC